MCATCGWLEIAAAVESHLATRDMRKQTEHILAKASAIIQANEHVTTEQADAIQAIREREGWAA